MASASTLMSQQGRLTLVYTEKLKLMIKCTISGRMLSSGISHVAFTSVYSEKTRMKKCWITRNVLLSAQMGERALVELICIITSRYNEVK